MLIWWTSGQSGTVPTRQIIHFYQHFIDSIHGNNNKFIRLASFLPEMIQRSSTCYVKNVKFSQYLLFISWLTFISSLVDYKVIESCLRLLYCRASSRFLAREKYMSNVNMIRLCYINEQQHFYLQTQLLWLHEGYLKENRGGYTIVLYTH